MKWDAIFLHSLNSFRGIMEFYCESLTQYKRLKTKERGLRSNSYYNEGVVLGKQQKLEESIETYKNALRQNPDNTEARENLQKALLELKKKNQKQVAGSQGTGRPIPK